LSQLMASNIRVRTSFEKLFQAMHVQTTVESSFTLSRGMWSR